MNKTVSFLASHLSLFIMEVLISFVALILIDISQHGIDSFFINKAWNGSGLWNFWRALFFGLPYIILHILLFQYVVKIKLYKPLLISLFNLTVYVKLSVLSKVIWGENVPLPPEGIMFWVTCAAIFLSPLFLVTSSKQLVRF
jgi:hypothetical protein